MNVGTLSGIATAAAMLAFVLATIWAMNPRRRKDFERVQMLPLEEDVQP